MPGDGSLPARKPVAPYMAVGLSTYVYGIAERKHIAVNLDIIEDNLHAAMSMVNINMPVKLIALSEGALTGFTDEAFDLPHTLAARDLFIEIPGPESERLAALARLYETYIVVQCKARWPEVMADRYFNTMFVLSPTGEIVHKAAKNHLWCRERSCTPHDVYDRWVELFGDGIDAFYPVLRTDDIGDIGTICCSDGEYPEVVRALALNGAEVVYRPSEAMPMTGNSLSGRRQLDDPEPGSRAVQQRLHDLPQRRAGVPAPEDAAPRRHRGRELAHRRLLRQRHVLFGVGREHDGGRDHRRRGPAQLPRDEPQLELDQGPPHRDLPAHVRPAHPPEEPLAGAGAP